jgi:hypothetical protein
MEKDRGGMTERTPDPKNGGSFAEQRLQTGMDTKQDRELGRPEVAQSKERKKDIIYTSTRGGACLEFILTTVHERCTL